MTAEPAEPAPDKDFDEQLDPGFEGHWVGYVEDPFQRDELGQALPAVFPSGSTEVTLDYGFVGERFEPSATIVFGAGPAQVPASGAAYPSGVDYYLLNVVADSFEAPVVEGFGYALEETSTRVPGYDPGSSSLLSFQAFAAFQPWCEVQASLPTENGRFSCIASSGLSGGDPRRGEACFEEYEDGSTLEVDCNFAAMCFSDLCRCSEEGCSLNLAIQYSDVFLDRRGDEIVGTISGALIDSGYPGWFVPMGTLHLFRAD